jgi:iron complex outermembrane recepter protein
MSDLTQGCVPVNIFATSIYGRPFGNFATQAERDYVFGSKVFDTTYEQVVFNAFTTGNIIDLPAGPVGAVFGVEYRNDKINSQPDLVTANGLLIQQNSDRGAKGSKWIKEAFGELDIPLQAGKPWVEELNLKLAGRVTDEEFYGTNYTYSLAAGWRPIEPLQIKFTYGTSFRAPNLRENFLAGQSGFLTLIDPCAVPDVAFRPLAGGYTASLDTRDVSILSACRREGRDPTRVGINAAGTDSDQAGGVEILSGGSLDIKPETSRSLTAGFAFEETFSGGFDVSLGFNYYDIKIKAAIAEPSSQFIINDCFARQNDTRSSFCDRIAIDSAGNERLLITDVNSGFINLNQESVRGLDVNAAFSKDVQMFGTNVGWNLNLRANHLIERSSLFIGDDGSPSFDDVAGEFSFPKWTGRATLSADIDKFRLSWTTRYTGPVEQDPEGIDPLSDAFGRGPDGLPTGFVGDTCLGNGSGANVPANPPGPFVANNVVPGSGIFCRDVGFAEEQFYHTVSLRYRTDRYTFLIGVDNVFNTAPPKVDGNEVFSVANTAIGSGYEYDGREFFASVNVEF